jgi:hypothetical protein
MLLRLIVLLIQTDAHGSHERHIDAGRDLHGVRLLAEKNVLAAEQFAVDACNSDI